MNLSEGFIQRPVMTTLLTSALLIFGAVAYTKLPVSNLPNVDFPTIQVSANLPGASPETMASAVATPLERQFSTIAGIDSISSTSTQGGVSITLQFNLTRNIDSAAQDVQAAIAQVARKLPAQMPSPPSYEKSNPADTPVLMLALTSPTLPLYDLDEYGQTMLAQRLSMVAGVAQVSLFGSQKYAVRVRLDPRALAARGLGINEVAAAIDRGNANMPTGVLYGNHRAFTVTAKGQLERAKDYRPLIVAYRKGSPVRLEEIASVIDGVETDKQAAWFIDKRAMVLAVQRQPGTNTVEVAKAVRAVLPSFANRLPASVSMEILIDRSEIIEESARDVTITLVLTGILVAGVIFLFLRNFWATLIPSTAMPVSIVGTFPVMWLLNYSLDNLSLMALTLAVGFVADDAIVVLENVVRHMELGQERRQAALEGSRQISFTVLSMTLSLVSVFIPILFMGGIMGRLLTEFAVTLSVAILVSGVVSLSLTPMLCSRFLRHHKASDREGLFSRLCDRALGAMNRGYASSLRRVLDHPRAVIGVAFLTLAATVYLFAVVPKGFIPSEDTNFITASTEAIQGISPSDMFARQQAVAEVFKKEPGVAAFMSSAGSGGGRAGGGNTGRLMVRLTPRSQRAMSADQIIESLRSKLGKIPGIRVFPQNPPAINIGGRMSRSLYQFTLQSPDIAELYARAAELEDRMRNAPQLQDVTSDLMLKNPQVDVAVDRDKAASLGLTVLEIETALYNAFGSRQVSTILASQAQYQVILELLPEFQRDFSALSDVYVRSSSSGQLVPLATVATITQSVGPTSVNHSGQLPSVTISFNLKPGVALGDAVDSVQRMARELLPAGIATAFQGTAQAFQSSLQGLWVVLVLALVVIYLVLGVLYESFLHPLTVLAGLPSAAVGGLLTLLAFGQDLSIYAFVGVFMLIGIVKKNAIMMIDFALEREREGGLSPRDAIYEGCLVRFRPIMMTTLAALMGGLLIALGMGAGAESRRPLGLVVVGGLAFSQLITLYITPVVYLYMDRLGRWFSGRAPAGA